MYAIVALATMLSVADDLKPPVRVVADGKPINVDTGHAAPLVYDFDGDGVRDLLVGQFDGGKLRFYRNVGTEAAPKYGTFSYVQAGGAPASVNYG
ncbi:MAG: hypothetical protein ACO1SV_23865 [Fimbriimonas sp.]